MFKFIVASNNEGKIKEFKAMLNDFGEVVSQKEMHIFIEPKENGDTFEQNAIIKAKAVFNTLPKNSQNIFVLADDSGICVDDLGGEPGVKSARYASNNDKNSDDKANRIKLINELKLRGITSSPARFIACIALVGEGIRGERVEFCATGECEGRIVDEERGENGFGYDSIFIPNGFHQTLAQVSSEVKNSLSHRKKALEKIKEYLSLL